MGELRPEIWTVAVVLRAVEWWRNKRPKGWGPMEHLDNPTHGCINEDEKNLARAIAVWLIKKTSGDKDG